MQKNAKKQQSDTQVDQASFVHRKVLPKLLKFRVGWPSICGLCGWYEGIFAQP